AAILQFKHAAEIPGNEHAAYEADKTHLSGIGKMIDRVSTGLKEKTKVGVTEMLPTVKSLQDMMLVVNDQTKAQAIVLMNEHLKNYFSTNQSAEDRLHKGYTRGMQVMQAYAQGGKLKDMRTEGDKIAISLQGAIDKDKDELKQKINEYFQRVKVQKTE